VDGADGGERDGFNRFHFGHEKGGVRVKRGQKSDVFV
jgi:hypothetical protein